MIFDNKIMFLFLIEIFGVFLIGFGFAGSYGVASCGSLHDTTLLDTGCQLTIETNWSPNTMDGKALNQSWTFNFKLSSGEDLKMVASEIGWPRIDDFKLVFYFQKHVVTETFNYDDGEKKAIYFNGVAAFVVEHTDIDASDVDDIVFFKITPKTEWLAKIISSAEKTKFCETNQTLGLTGCYFDITTANSPISLKSLPNHCLVLEKNYCNNEIVIIVTNNLLHYSVFSVLNKRITLEKNTVDVTKISTPTILNIKKKAYLKITKTNDQNIFLLEPVLNPFEVTASPDKTPGGAGSNGESEGKATKGGTGTTSGGVATKPKDCGWQNFFATFYKGIFEKEIKAEGCGQTAGTNKCDTSFNIDGSNVDAGNEKYMFKCVSATEAIGCTKETGVATNKGAKFTIPAKDTKLIAECKKKFSE